MTYESYETEPYMEDDAVKQLRLKPHNPSDRRWHTEYVRRVLRSDSGIESPPVYVPSRKIYTIELPPEQDYL